MVFIKKLANADPGTSDILGGNDWDLLDDYHDNVDITPSVAKINTRTYFKSGKLEFRNPADTFSYILTAGAIAVDRILNLPVVTATDTIVVTGLAQTLTNKTLDSTCVVSSSALASDVVREGIANDFGDFDNSFKDNRIRIWNPADTFRYTIVGGAITVDRNLNLPVITATDTLSTLGMDQTFTGINTYKDSKVKIRNPADTFGYRLVASAITVDRDLTLPLLTGTDTLATLGLAQTFSLGQTFTKSIVANGGFNLQKVTKTSGDSPYTASSDDSVILYDASGGNSTINLPAAASNTGKQYKIVRTDILSSTTSLTIDANSTETIDGVLTWILRPAEKIEIISDGSNWIVTWHNSPSYSGYYYMKNSTNNKRYAAGYTNGNVAGTTSTTSPAANTLWALPLVVDKVTKFDLISFEITTLQASQNARAGIYKDNGNMYPGVLIFDTGSISTGTATLKDTTITSGLQIFQPGLYWLAWETDATTIQIRGMSSTNAGINAMFGLSTSWGTKQGYGYSVAHTYGALPDPYTGSATVLTTSPDATVVTPLIALRPI